MKENKNNFKVYTLTKEKEEGYSHWAKGLTMHITKDGITVELNEDEVQQLVKTLPRTVGGRY
jgi:hypothetical protein